jgi:hypothetical protein
MGTNYYAIQNKVSLHNRVIHIGKSSAGWKFLFQGYQHYGNPDGYMYDDLNINSVDDWKKFLDTDEYVILDEYDKQISYDDFFKLVEEKQSEENPDNFSDCANINGYRFSYRDFG